MTESTGEGTNDKFKIGISLWLSFCLFVCLWFLSRFMTGRRQMRSNLHVIEDGLRRMQEEIEKKQRDNSIGYGENLEELLEELKKDMAETKEEDKEKDALPKEAKNNEEDIEEVDETEILVQDKKND